MFTYETLILTSYFFVLSILAIYGWHRYFIVYQYMKFKDRVPGPPPPVAEWSRFSCPSTTRCTWWTD
jgi:hypothetical protein